MSDSGIIFGISVEAIKEAFTKRSNEIDMRIIEDILRCSCAKCENHEHNGGDGMSCYGCAVNHSIFFKAVDDE